MSEVMMLTYITVIVFLIISYKLGYGHGYEKAEYDFIEDPKKFRRIHDE